MERLAREDFQALERHRNKGGNKIPGIWLLEPGPYNGVRMERAAAMGYASIEMPADLEVSLRPLVGLQVWLLSKEKANDWVMAMAGRVMEVRPSGLYAHWLDLPDHESGHIIVPAAGRACEFDLYDLVRLTKKLFDDEAAERYAKNWVNSIQRIARWAEEDEACGLKPMSLGEMVAAMTPAQMKEVGELVGKEFGPDGLALLKPPTTESASISTPPAAAKPWWEEEDDE